MARFSENYWNRLQAKGAPNFPTPSMIRPIALSPEFSHLYAPMEVNAEIPYRIWFRRPVLLVVIDI